MNSSQEKSNEDCISKDGGVYLFPELLEIMKAMSNIEAFPSSSFKILLHFSFNSNCYDDLHFLKRV